MVTDTYSQAQEPGRSETYPDIPAGTDSGYDRSDEQIKMSDEDPRATDPKSGYTVVCGDRKWEVDKEVLCDNNKWFRAAFEGPFQEASTKEVVIEDTDPNMVQIVIDTICRGGTYWEYSKPAEIVEIWKAGDFFGVRQLVYQAERAMREYLDESSEFLGVNQRNGCKGSSSDICPDRIAIDCSSCRTQIYEPRECAVRNLQPLTVLYLRDRRYGPCHIYKGVCIQCHARSGETGPRPLEKANWLTPSQAARADWLVRDPVRCGPHFRIEKEIRALCEALVVATDGTSPGSRIQKMLIDHLCTTHVAMWNGRTVCKFLET